MIAVLEDAVNCFLKQMHATDPKARQIIFSGKAMSVTRFFPIWSRFLRYGMVTTPFS